MEKEKTFGELIFAGIKGGIAIGSAMVLLYVCASYNSRKQNEATSEGNYEEPQKSVNYWKDAGRAWRFFVPPKKKAKHKVSEPQEEDPRYDGCKTFD